MKKVISVTLGSSAGDFEFQTRFLDQDFTVQRIGADGDDGKAWELLRRAQSEADVVGLGSTSDHYQVGSRTIINRETERLKNVVTRVPVTTGATVRRILQVRAVRHVQKELVNYFNNNLTLFLSGMRNYEMAVAMSDYTRNLKFADAILQTGAPTLLTSLEQLELYAQGNRLATSLAPVRMIGNILDNRLNRVQKQALDKALRKSHTIVGTFGEIHQLGTPDNLGGKTLITSAVDDERLAFYKDCNVNLVVDVSPKLFERVVGLNTLQAMILAALETTTEELSDDDIMEILDELKVKPRLLHPTGKFRNIRRFAFVVHPLSQEAIKMGLPIPKNLVPRPVKWRIRFLPPVDFSGFTAEDAGDSERVHGLATSIRDKVQRELRKLQVERGNPWI